MKAVKKMKMALIKAGGDEKSRGAYGGVAAAARGDVRHRGRGAAESWQTRRLWQTSNKRWRHAARDAA
jgi:hypothetical protein